MDTTQPEDTISLDHVTLKLAGRVILREVNFQITAGEFVSVLGPNGAGKTTLLKLLLGLLKPNTGAVTVLGASPRRGNNAIGYAPQHRVLESDVALRARDVVGFGLDGHHWGIGLPNTHRTKMIDTVLREVDALQFADAPIAQLSGGEQQRLLIAQALITDPQILLLDEPLANLDIHHTQEIVTLLAKICHQRKVTILLVAHDVNPLLPVIDKVLYMANGQTALGAPNKVITNATLSQLYGTSVEVVRALDRIFVVGAET